MGWILDFGFNHKDTKVTKEREGIEGVLEQSWEGLVWNFVPEVGFSDMIE